MNATFSYITTHGEIVFLAIDLTKSLWVVFLRKRRIEGKGRSKLTSKNQQRKKKQVCLRLKGQRKKNKKVWVDIIQEKTIFQEKKKWPLISNVAESQVTREERINHSHSKMEVCHDLDESTSVSWWR